MRRALPVLLLALLLPPVSACSSLLPRSSRSDSPFRSFEEAKEAFDAVEVGRTRTDELRALRIDPERQGVTLLSGAQLLPLYLPHEGATVDLHGEGLRTCAQSGERCEGWVVDVERDRRRRTGNWFLDVLRFKRVKDQRGFDFTGVMLVLDDVVVHKIWSGSRKRMQTTEVQPLGLLQSGARARVPNPLELPPFTIRVRAGTAKAEARRAGPTDIDD
jgi:hypothetical protein